MKNRNNKNYLFLLCCLALFFCRTSLPLPQNLIAPYSTSPLFNINIFSVFHYVKATKMEEICDNAIDDDEDGTIDLNDPDCTCILVEPVSLIPNPSFEDLNCCPSGRSQLRCADVWVQASEPTTDLIHACDWLGWEQFPPPMPFPDGESILGFRDGRVRQMDPIPEPNWKEYAGACLLSPLKANTTYRFEFYLGFVDPTQSPPIDITFFGTTDCENLPFGNQDEAFGCPTNGPNWIELGATNINGGVGNTWVQSFIEVTPTEDITAIAIGPSCNEIRVSTSIYYFFDNLVLADRRTFDAQIRGVDHPCSNAFTLMVGEEENYEYQWYKEGIALIGETSHQLEKMYGDGKYQIRTRDAESCKVSATYTHIVPTFTESINETICPEEVFSFGTQQLTTSGTYSAIIKTENNCDNEITLQLKVLDATTDTLQATIFEGESFDIQNYSFRQEGTHIAMLPSTLGCDSLVVVNLNYYHVFVPNIFSPNGDGINDSFSIFTKSGLIEQIELQIFNRWGERVYNGTDWDGMHNGSLSNPGVYLFTARLRMDDGKERLFTGDITLIL